MGIKNKKSKVRINTFKKLCDLSDILKLFKEMYSPMEQCEDFLKIADIISNYDKLIKPIDKLVYYAGNEVFLLDIVTKVLQYLRFKGYLNADNTVNAENFDVELRKINFLLFLNSEVSFKHELKKDEKIVHVLQMMPVLKNTVVYSCVWGLNLDEYFYEILRYTPLWFCQPLLEGAIKSMKIAKPYDVLKRSKMILESIYYNIIRSDCDDTNQKDTYDVGRFYNSINAFLKLFSEPPDTTAMEKWKKMKKFEYQGHALKTLLEIVTRCLHFYFNKRVFTHKDRHELYRLLQKPIKDKEYTLNSFSSWTKNVLDKINHSMLNTLQTLVFDVSVDLFMSWTEFDVEDEKEGEEAKTLQLSIGELSYMLRDIIDDEKIDHDIGKQLAQISIKPKTPEDKAKEMTLGEMMTKLESKFDDREIYFKLFMEKGEAVYGNLECLATVAQNIDLVDYQMLVEMIRFDVEGMVINDEGDSAESLEKIELKKIIYKKAKSLPLCDIIQLVKFITIQYGYLFNCYESFNFGYKIVEFTNKMRYEEEDVIEKAACYDLIFENGTEFFANLTRPLYDPAFNNDNFIDEIIKTIEKTKEVAYDYINQQIENILGREFKIAKSRSLQVFITKLYCLEGFFDRNMFVKIDLMDAIEKAHEDGHFEGLLAELNLVKMLFDKFSKFIRTDVLEFVAIKLAKMSESMRYDLVKNESAKSVERVQILDIILKIIEIILDVLKDLQEDGKSAILAKTTNFSKLTRYHFQKLANNDKIEFVDFVLGEELEEGSTKQHIRTVLSKIFLKCTTSEIELLATNPKVMGCISDAVLIITTILSQQENHFEAMKHTILNLLIINDKIILPEKKTDPERTKILKSFQSIIENVPEASKGAIIEAIISGIAAILTKIEHENPEVDVSFIRKLLNFT